MLSQGFSSAGPSLAAEFHDAKNQPGEHMKLYGDRNARRVCDF